MWCMWQLDTYTVLCYRYTLRWVTWNITYYQKPYSVTYNGLKHGQTCTVVHYTMTLHKSVLWGNMWKGREVTLYRQNSLLHTLCYHGLTWETKWKLNAINNSLLTLILWVQMIICIYKQVHSMHHQTVPSCHWVTHGNEQVYFMLGWSRCVLHSTCHMAAVMSIFLH